MLPSTDHHCPFAYVPGTATSPAPALPSAVMMKGVSQIAQAAGLKQYTAVRHWVYLLLGVGPSKAHKADKLFLSGTMVAAGHVEVV